MARQPHGALLLGLTVVAASVDALSFLGLGRVFPANMTGNTVLLGIGLATGDLTAAARSATALGAFVFGAAVVGAVASGHRRRPDRMLLAVVAVEVVLMAAFAGWWLWLRVDAPDGAAGYGLIALAGTTMGAQSAMTRSLGVAVSTTYITGTWTTVSASIGPLLARRADRSLKLQALVVTAYLATAAATGLAYRFLAAAATFLPLAILALVLIAAATRYWISRRGQGRSVTQDRTP
ncbi:DUF1275 family protein [Pseudonocardia acaciae]|uniref:DUF1275 family protein n=1 Tax=Pseudonocardia acaciae TaxID=551276 RepID=UPI00146FD395|nr:YoaK family protein [Pseudonocardia acaciae]